MIARNRGGGVKGRNLTKVPTEMAESRFVFGTFVKGEGG